MGWRVYMSTTKIYKRWQIWVILWLIITAVNLYRIDTKPLVSGGNPPIIEFEGGRGHLQLYVMGPYTFEQRKQDKIEGGDKDYYMWQLDPGGDNSVFGLSITYGIAPNGFRQVYPADGKPPKPLIEGKIYSVILPNSNCSSTNVESESFMINNGKAVIIPTSQITDK
jgi:hypothetical protein